MQTTTLTVEGTKTTMLHYTSDTYFHSFSLVQSENVRSIDLHLNGANLGEISKIGWVQNDPFFHFQLVPNKVNENEDCHFVVQYEGVKIVVDNERYIVKPGTPYRVSEPIPIRQN